MKDSRIYHEILLTYKSRHTIKTKIGLQVTAPKGTGSVLFAILQAPFRVILLHHKIWSSKIPRVSVQKVKKIEVPLFVVRYFKSQTYSEFPACEPCNHPIFSLYHSGGIYISRACYINKIQDLGVTSAAYLK